MIEAQIVKDSVGPNGIRLTTFVLTYPRLVHSEFMTHRTFSRNASSSRAIPVKKQIQMVIDNPAIPLAFTKNKAGMQGGEALNGEAHDLAVKAWLDARDQAVIKAQDLLYLEVHKQYCNRLLEPFSHITVVCTATDFSNFFALRCHEMAQPEIHALADAMYAEYQASTPETLQKNQWHLPFITDQDFDESKAWLAAQGKTGVTRLLIRRSVAKCARVSYLNHEGKPSTIEQDLELYDRLVGADPKHCSPTEHIAKAVHANNKAYSGNLKGWTQFRKTLKGENMTEHEKTT